jgi:hypothetical protein
MKKKQRLKSYSYWDIMPLVVRWKEVDVSEEHVTSIFRIKE